MMLKQQLLVALQLFFAYLIFISQALSDSGEESYEKSGPLLLCSKALVNKYVAQEHDLTVTYTLYNIGESPAFDIILKDKTFNSDSFSTEAGLIDAKWENLPPGENFTHTIVLKPKISGNYNISYGEISYYETQGSSQQIIYTTAPGMIYIISSKEYEKLFSSHMLDWFTFGVMTLPSLLIPYLFWYKSKTRYESLLQKSVKKR